MKKYIILSVITVFFTFIIIISNKSYENKIPIIETSRLSLQKATETVRATGSIENINSTEVEYGIPVIIKKIYVSEGQYVNRGDELFEIDKEKTVETLVNGGFIMSSVKNIDFSLITALPEKITSVSDGYISEINYKSGDLYDTLNPVMKVSRNDDFQAVLEINENNISDIKVGQSVKMTVIGLKSEIYGKIIKIGDYAKQTITESAEKERTVNVYAKILSKSVLKSGFSVSGIITTNKSEKIIVPYESILQDETGEYIYTVIDCYAEKTYIKTQKDFSKGSSVSNKYNGVEIVKNPEKLKGDKIKLIL